MTFEGLLRWPSRGKAQVDNYNCQVLDYPRCGCRLVLLINVAASKTLQKFSIKFVCTISPSILVNNVGLFFDGLCKKPNRRKTVATR